MRKKLAIILAIGMAVAVSVSLMANPDVIKFESKGKKVHFTTKNGKKVNSCNYCHVDAKIEKKKQGLMKGQPNFASIKARPLCSGSGCHQ